MEDITPNLLKKIQGDFQSEFDKSKVIAELYAKVRDGTATYKEANQFAIEVGDILAGAYKNNLSSSVLPEGKMYYNIAQRILNPTMKNNYNLITEVTDQVQQSLNEAAHIGIKPITPELNQDRIDGMVNRISSEECFDDVAWMLGEPIVNFSQNIVDDSIRENAEFHGKAGMSPKIVRKLAGGCCDWCREVAGTYSYPDVPKDVYRRHQRCRCTVDYNPRSGKIQNVHSKQWRRENEQDKINARKLVGLTRETIENQTFVAHKSVGAMATKFYVKKTYALKENALYIKEGTEVTGIKVIAEGSQIREVQRLIDAYPKTNGEKTVAKDWYKVRGRAIIVDGKGYEESREIHWYQAENIGKVEFKFPSNKKQR